MFSFQSSVNLTYLVVEIRIAVQGVESALEYLEISCLCLSSKMIFLYPVSFFLNQSPVFTI
jgi:hypothetical protein